MTCIEHPARLDQQKFDLVFGIRLVFDAFRDDEHFARRHPNCAVAKIDPQNTFQNNKYLISVLVFVPKRRGVGEGEYS
jgi:hypothetical protein